MFVLAMLMVKLKLKGFNIMEQCKLVVRRFTAGLDFIGDCVNAYPFNMYLGDLVEGVGGAFVILEVTGCNERDQRILELMFDNINPIVSNKKYGLRPVQEGEPFFAELKEFNRATVTIETLLTYKVEH